MRMFSLLSAVVLVTLAGCGVQTDPKGEPQDEAEPSAETVARTAGVCTADSDTYCISSNSLSSCDTCDPANDCCNVVIRGTLHCFVPSPNGQHCV